MPAEVEVKFRVFKKNLPQIMATLESLMFLSAGMESIEDYFLAVERSKAGWNFTRLRDNGRYWLTVKDWVVDRQGNRVRREEEREISGRKFRRLKSKSLFGYRKTRQNFKGIAFGGEMTVSLDTVKANNRDYCFIEAEMESEVDNSEQLRRKIKYWATLCFGVYKEAPPMMDFLIKHGMALNISSPCSLPFSVPNRHLDIK